MTEDRLHSVSDAQRHVRAYGGGKRRDMRMQQADRGCSRTPRSAGSSYLHCRCRGWLSGPSCAGLRGKHELTRKHLYWAHLKTAELFDVVGVVLKAEVQAVEGHGVCRVARDAGNDVIGEALEVTRWRKVTADCRQQLNGRPARTTARRSQGQAWCFESAMYRVSFRRVRYCHLQVRDDNKAGIQSGLRTNADAANSQYLAPSSSFCINEYCMNMGRRTHSTQMRAS